MTAVQCAFLPECSFQLRVFFACCILLLPKVFGLGVGMGCVSQRRVCLYECCPTSTTAWIFLQLKKVSTSCLASSLLYLFMYTKTGLAGDRLI